MTGRIIAGVLVQRVAHHRVFELGTWNRRRFGDGARARVDGFFHDGALLRVVVVRLNEHVHARHISIPGTTTGLLECGR